MHKNFDNEESPIGVFLKKISSEDFMNLGMQDVAYVKKISLEGKKAYAVHAADGTPLSVERTMDLAFALVKQNDLNAVTTH